MLSCGVRQQYQQLAAGLRLGPDRAGVVVLDVVDAVQLLLKMEEQKGQGIIDKDKLVIILCGLGSGKEIKRAAPIRELLNDSFPPLPTVIIVPGRMHFMEKKALEVISK